MPRQECNSATQRDLMALACAKPGCIAATAPRGGPACSRAPPLGTLRELRGSPSQRCNTSEVRRGYRWRRSRLSAAQGNAASGKGMAAGDEPLAVLIVDHGSRRKESNDMLLKFVELYHEATGMAIVEGAHMELAEPTISQAFDACVRRGARRVAVAPYFFFPGKHIQEDIPRLVEEAAASHPGVEWVIAEPIGLDVRMADVVHSRVQASLVRAD